MEAIKKLEQDLPGLADIDDGQRQHLRELIAQGQSNINKRGTEGFPVEDMERLFAEYRSAGIRLIGESQLSYTSPFSMALQHLKRVAPLPFLPR